MKTEILKVGAPVNLDNMEVAVPTNVTISAPKAVTRKRVVRTIVLDGPTEWVDQTLARSWVQPDRTSPLGPGRIMYEIPRKEEEYETPESV